MFKVKNLQEYQPAYQRFGDAVYLRDDQGRDWYDLQKQFQAETLKVAYDPTTKIIVGAGFNLGNPDMPDSFWPAKLSVAELQYYPLDFNVFDDNFWVYNEDTDTISKRVETVDEAKVRVASEIKEKVQDTMLLINPLQFAKDLEEITEEEATRLKALQKYVILLNRVPQQETYPTGVVWPEIPTT